MISSPLAIATASLPLACLALAAVTDLRHRIIPNGLVLAVVLSGLTLRTFDGALLLSLSVLLCVGVVALLGLLAGVAVIGWGDAKLIGAATLLVPLRQSGNLLLAIAVAGGILSGGYLLAQFILRKRIALSEPKALTGPNGFAAFLENENGRILTGPSMPYAVAVLAGVFYKMTIETMRCWPAILSWQ
jgi:Flp pilus assembly protein protease CpaA